MPSPTSLNGATTNIQELTGKLNRGEGTAGKLMTDDSLFNRLNAVTGTLRRAADEAECRGGDGWTVAER